MKENLTNNSEAFRFVEDQGRRNQTIYQYGHKLKLGSIKLDFSPEAHCYQEKLEVKDFEVNTPSEEKGKFYFTPKNVNIPSQGIVVIDGFVDKKGKEFKHYQYLNHYLLTYNQEGELVNQKQIQFDYPKVLGYAFPLRDPAISDTLKNINGAVFVYTKPPYMGKKSADPEHTLHIYTFDKEGKPEDSFDVVNPIENRKNSEIMYAHRINDEVRLLLYNYVGDYRYSLIKLKKGGEAKVITFNNGALNENTSNDGKPYHLNRITGHYQSPDGSVVYYGTSTGLSIPDSQNSPNGMNTQEGKFFKYFHFIQTNPEGEFVHRYIFNKGWGYVRGPGDIVPVASQDNKLILTASISNLLPQPNNFMNAQASSGVMKTPFGKLANALNKDMVESQMSNIQSGKIGLNKSFGRKLNRYAQPLVITIDLNEKKLTSINFQEEKNWFYNLAYKTDYAWDAQKKILYICGRQTETPDKITLKKIQY
ncbi:hypothetical protein AAG747_06380 [Rapidithrix thailandica]|uniref:Uncharacterized protein n=1 Tax=Rapidithrix thailandica TaxID=413964 RepID=A0AAW9RWT9_9BACT